MDILTLAATAYTLSKPFLEKAGEGAATKIGEDIWNIIKKPFQNKGKEDVETLAVTDESTFKSELTEHLKADEALAKDLEKLVAHSQVVLSGQFQQNINSYDKVEKQINIQSNSGNIQM